MTTADKIRTALADPDSPFYGSDLVPLVADYLDEAEQAKAVIQTAMPTVEGWYWVSHWERDEPDDIPSEQWQLMYFVPTVPPQLLGFAPEIHVLNQAMQVSRWQKMPDSSWEDADPINGQYSGTWCGPKRWLGPLLSPMEVPLA